MDSMLTCAIQAAREAGKHMRTHMLDNTVEKIKSSKNDLVTVIDRECQDIIYDCIHKAFPEHAFLGEENVDPGHVASAEAFETLKEKEWLWIVDPIDGTTNFVHHRPSSVVSIACAHKNQVIVGVIYDPYREEMFSASLGKGAFLNEHQISVSKECLFEEALIGFGIGTKANVREPMFDCVRMFTSQCRGIRLQGAAALELAWVACGRQTGFYELDLNSWDIAAGALLIKEAKGKVTDANGKEFSLEMRNIVASNGAGNVHTTMVELIQESNANEIRL